MIYIKPDFIIYDMKYIEEIKAASNSVNSSTVNSKDINRTDEQTTRSLNNCLGCAGTEFSGVECLEGDDLS